MKNKSTLLSVLAIAMALGTAWAVRGKFGHEQGAAWAGAIGGLAVLLIARRGDWNQKAFPIVAAAAFGWGISGVMSYGAIVGYGRGTDFINVFYGLLMLFVLGVLYGFIGGGFFGLALLDSKTTRVKWASLIAQMVAIGLLAYGLLINQLGWLMTPPRSEMWAACLGAAIALAWYIARNKHTPVLKVAVCSALGAGFGFAFGNFLQVMGNTTGFHLNFWNVMEYSIGFFGGAGMAYGTFSSEWPVSDTDRSSGWLALVFIVLFIPLVVWQQTFVPERFDFVLQTGGTASTVLLMRYLALAAIVVVAFIALLGNMRRPAPRSLDGGPFLKRFFILYTVLYIFLSFLVTGVFIHPPEQYLYIVNLAAILLLISRSGHAFDAQPFNPKVALIACGVVVIIALMAVVAINSHGEVPGIQKRFSGELPGSL
jgi:hypothetical protein